jgi:hypothetical protein
MWRTYYRSLDDPNVFVLNLKHARPRSVESCGSQFLMGSPKCRSGPGEHRSRLETHVPESVRSGSGLSWNARMVIGAHYIHQSLIRALKISPCWLRECAYIYANPAEGIAVSVPL